MFTLRLRIGYFVGLTLLCIGLVTTYPKTSLAQTFSESGSVGLKGVVPGNAPSVAPQITIPSSGTTSRNNPITVSGLCSEDLLVKIFKNGVFGGSVQCQSGSFSMSVDLFEGTNDLIAKQYDLLDQESPPSSTVSVTYTSANPSSTASEQVSLTSNFAKRGANPRELLSWPIIISGGQGPYAVTVEWGDGEDSILSIVSPGEFDIEHTYSNPGVYTIVVKAVDVNGKTAYLQLVAIGNGALEQAGVAGAVSDGASPTKTRILWQPAAIMIPFIISTFWLGKRYAIHRLKRKIEAGERPFSY